ncbi:hypothetical protein DSUL_50376 [Desulfovibrionales bacterium]
MKSMKALLIKVVTIFIYLFIYLLSFRYLFTTCKKKKLNYLPAKKILFSSYYSGRRRRAVSWVNLVFFDDLIYVLEDDYVPV